MKFIDEWNDTVQLLKITPEPQVGQAPPNAPSKRDKVNQAPAHPGTDAEKVKAELQGFGLDAVHCFRDEGFPWVEVARDKAPIAYPFEVASIGQAIQKAVGRVVLFHEMRVRSALYVVDHTLRRDASEPELPAGHYGTPVNDLGATTRPATKATRAGGRRR